MKITYKLLAELIEFLIIEAHETNDVKELIQWLRDNEGYISEEGGRTQ